MVSLSTNLTILNERRNKVSGFFLRGGEGTEGLSVLIFNPYFRLKQKERHEKHVNGGSSCFYM